MKLGKTIYITERKKWREWLAKNYDKKKDIWLIFYRKASGKRRISYDDAVEEALCFGWIDSIVKKVDEDGFAQRFTPRRSKSPVSELNKERIRRLIKTKQMTKAGLIAVGNISAPFQIPPDILKELKKDRETWNNFQRFSKAYKNIRIAFIEGARKRPEEFKRRLNYFLKMTTRGKKFGTLI